MLPQSLQYNIMAIFTSLSNWGKDPLRLKQTKFCINLSLLYIKTNRFQWHTVILQCAVTHSAIALCASILFLPHFNVICDLLLNRRTATWNLVDIILVKPLLPQSPVLAVEKWIDICGKTTLVSLCHRSRCISWYNIGKTTANKVPFRGSR